MNTLWLQWVVCWDYTLRKWGVRPDRWHPADVALLNMGVFNRWYW